MCCGLDSARSQVCRCGTVLVSARFGSLVLARWLWGALVRDSTRPVAFVSDGKLQSKLPSTAPVERPRLSNRKGFGGVLDPVRGSFWNVTRVRGGTQDLVDTNGVGGEVCRGLVLVFDGVT